MRMRTLSSLLLLSSLFVCGSLRAADEYTYDLVHSSVSFKARHLDLSWIHGRFNLVDGKFSLPAEQGLPPGEYHVRVVPFGTEIEEFGNLLAHAALALVAHASVSTPSAAGRR